MGGKASSAAVALAGMFAVVVVGIFLRKAWWLRALKALIESGIFALLTYRLFLSGVSINDNLTSATSVRASTWQQLDPLVGKWGPLAGTIGLSLAALARFGGLFWLGLRQPTRTQPAILVSLGALAAGIAALFVLRGGINDLWFVLAASAPAAVVSAYGVGQATQWLNTSWIQSRPRNPLTVAVLVSLVASAICIVLSLNWNISEQVSRDSIFAWPGLIHWLAAVSPWIIIPVFVAVWVRWRSIDHSFQHQLFVVVSISAVALTLTSVVTRPAVLWTQSRQLVTDKGLVNQDIVSPGGVQETGTTGTTSDFRLIDWQIAAAQWLSVNTEETDIIGTSAPFTAQIPALTGRQMYLAGADYQRGLGDATQVSEVDQRIRISEGVQTDDWDQSVRAMCSQGVQYLWLEGESGVTQTIQPIQVFGPISLLDLNQACGNG